MTLRRIHQNLSSIKNQRQRADIQCMNKHEQIFYDEQQPAHPKMFVDYPVNWANSRIKDGINYGDIKASTSRDHRSHDSVRSQRNQAGNFTALNSSRKSRFETITPDNNHSPHPKQQLFVPERKSILDKNKLAAVRTNPKVRNTSFTSYNKQSFTNEQNQELTKSKIKQFSQIKLIKPNKTIHHISHLRKYQNQQKQRQILLNNRLKFITIGNQKDNKKLQMVKSKFEKVISIRSQSLRQKQILNKTKGLIDTQQREYKFSKVNYVKEQQNNRRLSVSRLSRGKSMHASMLRQEEKSIQREMLSSRLTELQKKKEIVRNAQTSLERSRQRISELNRSRVSSIRSIQNKTLVKNYMNVQKREKINEKLNLVLQRQIKLINQRKLKAASQLKEYEDFLGLSRDKSKEIPLMSKNKAIISIENSNRTRNGQVKMERAVSSTFSTSGSKSFYLTNY